MLHIQFTLKFIVEKRYMGMTAILYILRENFGKINDWKENIYRYEFIIILIVIKSRHEHIFFIFKNILFDQNTF